MILIDVILYLIMVYFAYTIAYNVFLNKKIHRLSYIFNIPNWVYMIYLHIILLSSIIILGVAITNIYNMNYIIIIQLIRYIGMIIIAGYAYIHSFSKLLDIYL